MCVELVHLYRSIGGFKGMCVLLSLIFGHVGIS